jgi:transposase-like protein
MDILSVFRAFQTQEQCLAHLEQTRWKGRPECPYCDSPKVCRHVSGDRANQRWQCQKCSRAFSVTVGTIFHRTHIPLQKWFLLLALMLNAKKSASACQIARDIGMRRPTVWSMMHRVRVAMEQDQRQGRLLHGLVEADETYIGGKPRRSNQHGGENPKGGMGRGTTKTPVLGVVERGGRVVAQPAKNASGRTIKKFISSAVESAGTILLTDQWTGYNPIKAKMLWASVNHSVEYVNG